MKYRLRKVALLWISKKKKKKGILPNITAKLFVFGVIGNHFGNYYIEASLRFGKLCKHYDKYGTCFFIYIFIYFFYCNRRSEKLAYRNPTNEKILAYPIIERKSNHLPIPLF